MLLGIGDLVLSVAGNFLTDGLRQAIRRLLPRPSDSLQDLLAEAFRRANQELLASGGLSSDLRRIAEQLRDDAATLFTSPPGSDSDPVLLALLVGEERELKRELSRRIEPWLRAESDGHVLFRRLVPALVSMFGQLLRDQCHHQAWTEFQQVLLQTTIRAINEQPQGEQNHTAALLELLDRLDRLARDNDHLEELGNLLARTLSSIPADTARATQATLSDLITHAFERQQAAFEKLAAEIRRPPEDRSIFNLPARNRTFSGRDHEIPAIHEELTGPADGVHGVALWGLGGIGKTALAIEYAHRHAADYDLVWWVTTTKPEAAAADLARLASKLGIRQTAQQDTLEELWGVLARRDRWLVVFDDADNPEDLRPFWPSGGSGHVLVTSRNPHWGTLAAPIEVSVLDPDEATQFFDRRLRTANREAAEALAHELGHLPLALEQAAAYIEQTRISLADYLRRWRRRAAQMYALGRPSDYRQTVATTWSVSMEQVRSREPAAEDLLRLCAYLAPDFIPRDLAPSAPSLLPDRLARAASDDLEYDAVVATLVRYSLLRADAYTIDVHRLVQGMVREGLQPAQQQEWASTAVELVHAFMPSEALQEGGRHRYRVLAAHALAAAEHAEALGVQLETTAALFNHMGMFMEELGSYHMAQHLFQRALDVGAKAFGPADSRLAMIQKNLGLMLARVGDLSAARTMCEDALIRAQTLDPEGPGVARASNDLALVLDELGEFEAAKEFLQRAVAIWEATAGGEHPDHPELAMTLGNLGMVLEHLQDLEGAQAVLERALVMHEVTGTEGSTALHNLARVYEDRGELSEARAALERVLTAEQERYGPVHPEVAITLTTLASVVHGLGASAEAAELQRWALKVFRRALGPAHPQVAFALQGLATLLPLPEAAEEARDLFKESVQIFTAAGRDDRPQAAQAFIGLGLVLYRIGDLAAARSWLERAVTTHERFASGRTVPLQHRAQLATALHQLGQVMIDLRDFHAAIAYLRQGNEVLEGSPRPADRRRSTRALGQIGLAEYELGDLPAAKASYEQALAGYEPDRSGDRWLAEQLSSLARVLIDLWEFEEAKRTIEHALQVLEERDEVDLAAIGTLLSQLGLVLHRMGDLEEATDKFEWAAAAFETNGPPNDEQVPVISTTLYRLGVVLAEAERFEEAEQRFRQALTLERGFYGEGHPNTGMTLSLLAVLR